MSQQEIQLGKIPVHHGLTHTGARYSSLPGKHCLAASHLEPQLLLLGVAAGADPEEQRRERVQQHHVVVAEVLLRVREDLLRVERAAEAVTLAIGDGANDLPMLSAVNLGVAYYGKPLLRDALINRIDYTDLRSLSYLV